MSDKPTQKAPEPKFPIGAVVVINGLVTEHIPAVEATNQILVAASAGLTVIGHVLDGNGREFKAKFKEIDSCWELPERSFRRIR